MRKLRCEPVWIPFDEELPIENQHIIFTEVCMVKEYEPYVGIGIYVGEDIWNAYKIEHERIKYKRVGYMSDTHSVVGRHWHIEDGHIVAWMPLPEPWKGVNNERP